MQSSGATGNLRSHIRSVYGAGGISGFYAAVGPTIARASVLTAAQLGSYDESKQKLLASGFTEGFDTQ